MTDKEIQNWIEDNMYHADETPMIDVQTFYEGAKWMRDKALNLTHVVVPKGTFYCKNNQGSHREEMRCQNQCKHCLDCENLQ